MKWSIRITLLSSVFFSMQITFGVGQSITPWESTQLAESFIASFLRFIARSNAFSYYQLDDMSTIQKTLTEAMDKFNSSNTSSKTKFQALNIVFASTMAEIIAEEGGASIELKSDAIENALKSASLEIIGTTDMVFIEEIKSLTYTLAHSAANGVSTALFAKTGGYKQESFRQQESSASAKLTRINESSSQRGSETERQRQSNQAFPTQPNVPGDYNPVLPSTRLTATSLQTSSEQQNKESQVDFSSKTEPQKSPLRVFYEQEQQRTDGARLDIATASGGSVLPAEQSPPTSKVDRPRQHVPDDYEHIRKEESQERKSVAINELTGIDESTVPDYYGLRSPIVELPIIPVLEDKRPEVLKSPEPEGQRPDRVRLTAFSEAEESALSTNAKEQFRQRPVAFIKPQKVHERSPVVVDPRPETYDPIYNGLEVPSSVLEGMDSPKPPTSASQQQPNKRPIRKDTEVYSGFGAKAVAHVVSDNYVPKARAKANPVEPQNIPEPSDKGIQNERVLQKQVQSSQILNNREQFDYRYQNKISSEGKVPGNFPTGVPTKLPSSIYGSSDGLGLPRGNLLPEQKVQVEETGLSTQKLSEAGGLSVSYGSNDDKRSMSAAVATVTDDNKSINGTKGTYEVVESRLISNQSTSGHSNYVSAKSTANAPAAEGPGSNGPSRILNATASSEVSSTLASLISSSLAKSSTVSNSSLSPVGTTNPSLSYCKVLTKTLKEIVSSLIPLLESCDLGKFPGDISSHQSSMTNQSAAKVTN